MKKIFLSKGHFFSAITMISLLLVLDSCNKDQGPLIVPPTVLPPVSFANDVQPIFTSRCIACHGGSMPEANQNLEAGVAYSNIVNVVTFGYAPEVRVKPFKADSSVLFHKIFNDAPGIYGQQMPANGPPFLQTFEIDLIKRWINEGALNN